MRVSDRMALSTGERVGRCRSPSADLERAQRRLLRCTEGSGRWRERRAVLANQQHRERVRNRNECHRLTTEIVRRFGLIAVGDLTPAVGQRRTVQEQTWSLLQAQLAYKAEWAGREFVRVDSSHMSVTCSECGVADSPAYGRTRFECSNCENSMDADINSAINILQEAMAGGASLPTTPESSKLCAV